MCVMCTKSGGFHSREDSGGSRTCIWVFVSVTQIKWCWLTVWAGEYTFKGQNYLYSNAGKSLRVNCFYTNIARHKFHHPTLVRIHCDNSDLHLIVTTIYAS